MSTIWIVIIIALVLGIIASNIMLLKHTAKMDFKAKDKNNDKTDDN
ncbi:MULTISPECIES: DUF2897 family protein [Motilimonas]|uniref:DUF2897 family protein n=1 Tax=Motilimonas cestriensis TaxID=2742685 RepID=A0ABS8W5C0_9GAMM|nr:MULTISPECIES: DUF2897 family protein [Motilimonas]MCE0556794.1 DUF2897 family protein [Motilimonas sp. E26]MCE2593408.1 DUF2897 family protein [Motilimonas cestriensis]MDO6525156.1 DUF2897 family protein [Motilimonas sp. 1_MG-2023]